jgi:Ribbon-helix-helix domain
MKRVAMFLTENQIKRLKQVSKTTGLKVSELIRRFIDRGLNVDEAEAHGRKGPGKR